FNGLQALTSSYDKTLVLWDAKTGECLRRFEGHRDRIESVSLSRDDRMMASASVDHTLFVWDVGSGRVLHKIDGMPGEMFWSIDLARDNRLMATGSGSATTLWALDAVPQRSDLAMKMEPNT